VLQVNPHALTRRLPTDANARDECCRPKQTGIGPDAGIQEFEKFARTRPIHLTSCGDQPLFPVEGHRGGVRVELSVLAQHLLTKWEHGVEQAIQIVLPRLRNSTPPRHPRIIPDRDRGAKRLMPPPPRPRGHTAGIGDALGDRALLDWIGAAHRHARWTTSVCSGSFLLAAAGLLTGRRATTHWGWLDRLATVGAIPVSERIVRDGAIITAAGVSAGIDMALSLLGEAVDERTAQAVQLARGGRLPAAARMDGIACGGSWCAGAACPALRRGCEDDRRGGDFGHR
jgi:hypothetical protein